MYATPIQYGREREKNNQQKKVCELSAFLGVVGIIISIFTLMEMKKERDAAYYPDLYIENTDWLLNEDGRWGTIGNAGFQPSEIAPTGSSCFRMRVVNIGQSAAKNIEICFEEDNIKRVIDFYHMIAPDSEETFIIESTGGESISIGDKIVYSIVQTKQKYILPITSETEAFYLYLPHYIEAIIFTLQQEHVFGERVGEEWDFSVVASVKYEDNQGVKYQRRIPLKITVHSMSEAFALQVSSEN